VSQLTTRIRLHPKQGAPVATGKALAVLVTWFESPYFDFSEYLTFEITDSCDWCATNEPRPHSFTLPLDIEAALRQGEAQMAATTAGIKLVHQKALIDEHFERALGPRAQAHIAKMGTALLPEARYSLCMRIDDNQCETLSPLDLWWWAVSRTVGGPSETYRREHAQAEHRFVVSAQGTGLKADIRVFLPTPAGVHLRAVIAAEPHIVAVPQSILPSVGRLLPEAQPFLLPVLSSPFSIVDVAESHLLVVGHAEKLDRAERLAAQRAWRIRGKAWETRAMKTRAQLNRLVGALYGSPTIVRVLRVPSQMFPSLSRSARAALTSVGYSAPNPYLTDTDAQKLAVDVRNATS